MGEDRVTPSVPSPHSCPCRVAWVLPSYRLFSLPHRASNHGISLHEIPPDRRQKLEKARPGQFSGK